MRSVLGAAVLAALLAGAAAAHEIKEGAIKIEHPRAAPTPAGAKTGAAYMEIVNTGTEPLEIKALSSDAAEKVEVHSMTMTGDIMRMRPVELPLTIAPGESLKLVKDRHIMLIGLKKPLVEEDMVPFKIEFANGKKIEFDLYIEGDSEGHDEDEGH
jgi:periplasmic copper chaperone A